MEVFLHLSGTQSAVAAEARAAEIDGYDGVATGEHLFFHGPVANAFVSLAAAAGATTRVRLLSALTVLPLYPAALAAKLATTLDQVSGGRFDFGVGVGGEYPAEFVAAGVDPSRRGQRTDEAIELIRALWSGEAVTFSGEFSRVPGLALAPGPIQQKGPPLWIGGRRDAAIRRAGRYADVWMPYLVTPKQLSRGLVEARAVADGVGRDPATLGSAVFCVGSVHQEPAVARRRAVDGVSAAYRQDFGPLADKYLLSGDPDQVVARVREFAAAGARTLVFAPVGSGAERDEVLDLFTQSVLPRLRGDQRCAPTSVPAQCDEV